MLHLLSLPDIVLEKILSYLSYDDIAKYRIICRQFDGMCKQLLNKGFISAEKYHSLCLKSVKSLLPRRESERRNHAMARHCDILTAIETRISMLSMTFMKYADVGMCCFIPGKVIDEIFRVLNLLKALKTPPRAHEVLQELRDISSMAMEHFDEKIVPVLKQKVSTHQAVLGLSRSDTWWQKRMRIINFDAGTSIVAGSSHGSPCFNHQKTHCCESYTSTRRNKLLMSKMILKIKRQNFKLSMQSSKLRDYSLKLAMNELQMADMKKHVEELDQKYTDLAAKFSLIQEGESSCGKKRKYFPVLEDLETKRFKPALDWQDSTNGEPKEPHD